MNQNVAAILRTWGFLWNHPIASRDRFATFKRWFRWQVGARILGGDAVLPFVQGSRLLVRRGMAGATGNIYAGLHEFEEMAFMLHLLRPDELFVDVGANVGVYTVLAGAVARARCVSLEPIPHTYVDLVANLRLNDLEGRVRALQVGAGASTGECAFTTHLDTVNHAVAPGESQEHSTTVPIASLDDLLRGERPTLLKVDVEGFETKVFEGATSVLAEPTLLALIVELNGSGDRYGFNEAALADRLAASGFLPYSYAPFERALKPSSASKSSTGNTVFVRDTRQVQDRLTSAAHVSILGVSV